MNRLKYLKRQMCGRAKRDLMRIRGLHPNRALSQRSRKSPSWTGFKSDSPWRLRQPSSPERATLARMNSRVTTSRSSSGKSSVRRNSTASTSGAGVSVIESRCGR